MIGLISNKIVFTLRFKFNARLNKKQWLRNDEIILEFLKRRRGFKLNLNRLKGTGIPAHEISEPTPMT